MFLQQKRAHLASLNWFICITLFSLRVLQSDLLIFQSNMSVETLVSWMYRRKSVLWGSWVFSIYLAADLWTEDEICPHWDVGKIENLEKLWARNENSLQAFLNLYCVIFRWILLLTIKNFFFLWINHWLVWVCSGLNNGSQRYQVLIPGVYTCHVIQKKGLVKVKVLVAQLCLTLCNPMDCSLPGTSVPGKSYEQRYLAGYSPLTALTDNRSYRFLEPIRVMLFRKGSWLWTKCD